MLGDLFDSPWKILIIAIVILVLFGSRKLPDAARSLGKSMRILKTEISDLHEDEPHEQPAAATPAALQHPQAAAQSIGNQTQMDALQAQIDELRKQAAVNEAQPTQTTQAS
ncbi:MAG TPA: Sec-independent protein translocase subunit TatA [Streptosporangiaceae bacterium]|jgi:sec-independent protein translocase protein TatA